jgi:hypothetical protein
VAPGQTPKALPLSAKSIKVVLAIDPQLLLGVNVANGVAQVPFVVAVAGRHIKGKFNAKTLRRAVAVVTASGGEDVGVIIQGSRVLREDRRELRAGRRRPAHAVGCQADAGAGAVCRRRAARRPAFGIG